MVKLLRIILLYIFNPVKWILLDKETGNKRRAFTKRDKALMFEIFLTAVQAKRTEIVLLAISGRGQAFEYDYNLRDWREIK